ncbi:uncharacterized protein LOC124291148 [Haliotis rubra]|uniref:uncharacterized protein LOC124291148 n=1 Tax=Haliotis rubra TaxID=36100 RepID=UPI001EE508F9|nr:uncharacterized protein LOC124291148 [Haliotis rubra]
MQSIMALGLSALCVVLYFSVANAASGDCGTFSKAKFDVCVAAFSTANVLNLNDRKALIEAGNTTCPTDILSKSCTSFNVMIKCVNAFGFPEGCEMEMDKELKNQQFECTYKELAMLCPDATTIGGAAGAIASMSLLAACLIAAIFRF